MVVACVTFNDFRVQIVQNLRRPAIFTLTPKNCFSLFPDHFPTMMLLLFLLWLFHWCFVVAFPAVN